MKISTSCFISYIIPYQNKSDSLGITDTNTLESIQNQNENHFEFLDDSLTDLSSEVKTLRYLSEISFII